MKCFAMLFLGITVLFISQPLLYWEQQHMNWENTGMMAASECTPPVCQQKQQEQNTTSCNKTANTGCNTSCNTYCSPCQCLLHEELAYRYAWKFATRIVSPTYTEAVSAGFTTTLLQPPEPVFI